MALLSRKELSKLGLAALAVISIVERRLKKRNSTSARLWARPHIMARNSVGAFAKLLPVLREREPSQYRIFLPTAKPGVSSYCKRTLPSAERLAVTLRFDDVIQ